MRLRFVFTAMVSVLVASLSAHGEKLAEVTGGMQLLNIPQYAGQSFYTFGSGSYSDISFNFYTSSGSPYSIGTGYLFSAPYAGTPASLSSAASAYLGSAVATDNVYNFGSAVTLTADQTYYFYEDSLVPQGSIVGGPTASDYFYTSYAANYIFGPTISTSDYLVTGEPLPNQAPAPEPSSLMLLGMGALGVGLLSGRQLLIRQPPIRNLTDCDS